MYPAVDVGPVDPHWPTGTSVRCLSREAAADVVSSTPNSHHRVQRPHRGKLDHLARRLVGIETAALRFLEDVGPFRGDHDLRAEPPGCSEKGRGAVRRGGQEQQTPTACYFFEATWYGFWPAAWSVTSMISTTSGTSSRIIISTPCLRVTSAMPHP